MFERKIWREVKEKPGEAGQGYETDARQVHSKGSKTERQTQGVQ